MQVTLYDFYKKVNSTARPTGGTTYEGYLRNVDPVSMYTPTIRFNLGNNAPSYNYAYIPIFGNRYYFIKNWTHVEGHWEASLEVDVLATYKSEIGNQDMYVLRSSAEFDEYIADSKFPSTAKLSSSSIMFSGVTVRTAAVGEKQIPNLWNRDISQGGYIVSIYGNNDTGTGLNYYYMGYSTFTNFANALCDWDITAETGWQTATVELPSQFAKSIADPIQFIANVQWIPFTSDEIIRAGATPVGSIKLGYYTENAFRGEIAEVNPKKNLISCSLVIDLPKHPLAASRGLWVNGAPYTKYTLEFPPFGVIDVDSSALVNCSKLNIFFDIDVITGTAVLRLYGVGSGIILFLGSKEATFTVPVSLTQATVDVRGMVQGAADMAVGTTKAAAGAGKVVGGGVKMVATGGIAGGKSVADGAVQAAEGAAQAVGGYADYAQASQPKLKSTGGVGTFLPFLSGRQAQLYSEFYNLVDDYNADLGRPLCKVRKPKDIPGYIQADASHVNTIGSADEALSINNFLNGGFFYE